MPLGPFTQTLQSLSSDPVARGRQFEHLCKWFLLNDPVYQAQLIRVWLWDDWPERWGDEAGIDLVAETRDGHLWAVQAKCYDEAYSITKRDVDSFLSESARPQFSFRLLIATTNRVARLAARAMHAAEKPVGQFLRHNLERAGVAWPCSIDDLRPGKPQPKTPRPHQREAIDATIQGFRNADRGQVIMACGTGKTLAAVWIAAAIEAERTLVLVPSLSLMKQTIREWLVNSARAFEYLPVCSDDTVRDRDQIVGAVDELGFPATADPDQVKAFLGRSGPKVVFSTYQSSPVIVAADVGFDLAIVDEAHRCAGPNSSNFATILDDGQIKITKRLFMTATPRYFTERLIQAGADADFEIVSMDDDDRFGSVFYRLPFGEAIKQDLLSDYRVLVIGVDDEMYRSYAERRQFVTTEGQEITDARSLAAQIGVAKAMRDYDLRRVISFHSRVSSAKQFSESLPWVIEWMPEEERPSGSVWSDHVSGEGMTSGARETRLAHLRELDLGSRGVLSNARCLSEGVDVPTLDGVVFVDPKSSPIDITQAVGRAIRKADDKTLGTIVIPVFVGDCDDAEKALSESRFKPVWQVLRALREHDAALGEALDRLRRSLGRKGRSDWRIPEKLVLDLPTSIGEDFARAFETRIVESTTRSFEFWIGLLGVYVEREGHARVSQNHTEGEWKLGIWVSDQRSKFRRGKLDSVRARRLQELDGWIWDPYSAEWEAGFERLKIFVAREGHARVPALYSEDGFNLGAWLNTQRQYYKLRKLEAHRVRRLEELPGLFWDFGLEAWDAWFDRLTAFVKREGHPNVPVDHVEDGYKLGRWVVKQRAAHKLEKLDPARAGRLSSVKGWVWEVRTEGWEHGFSHLEAFVEREGHSLVPSDHVEGDEEFRLGMWVSNQRSRRRRLDASSLRRLEAVPGWVWNMLAADWEHGFSHLEAFVEREGHARVSSSHVEDGFKLGIWVSTQRSVFSSQDLAPDRVCRLEALRGWTWDSLDSTWERGIMYLTAFVEREGHARVPQGHIENRFQLGTWVTHRRQFHRKQKLAADRVRQLETLPGWVWAPHATSWEKGFACLTEFVRREGHAKVPYAHVEGEIKLGTWVGSRRSEFKQRRLAEERIRSLEALPGWTWDARSE